MNGPILIPDQYKRFASELALLATKHGINRCTVKLAPHFDSEAGRSGVFSRDVEISFCATDGRGRPDAVVTIAVSGRVQFPVVVMPSDTAGDGNG